MQGLRWVQMTDEERNEFLGNGGTGVISFSTSPSEPPFSLPISYGYYADTGSLYFRFAFPPDSGKEALLDDPISFVTYEKTDEGYRSVVASGHLEEVDDLPYDSAVAQRMWEVDIPLVDVFEQPPDDVTFRHFHLDPDRLTGRKEVGSQE
ncbi:MULTISPECIES: pyridoxamine 5'-phosphate oxidase family protein [unclassified Haladaptatus]|uniref:pyridoxamine 5'-phosphate oxidase family protein n=1 Tax=unclassified Haladaptatus TaxID=2622732 RepID=UPI00209C2F09|nr:MULTISPECIES: pyridoxamine 5'-phosphate oxidase family protein [unclassified Haladaptatus]MCO8244957.1 pyridoxamine 5'-phosphate oxidase family protein [Haladaptatus sp. AB643]MCO8253099.1 pyridoxamine 5'-phosphate oxidase family protein [Haladaptatus sp. AB618]